MRRGQTRDPHDHAGFTRFYRFVAGVGEHTAAGVARSEVLSASHGRLLIVGLGPGHDLAHLPPAVTSVVAVEPSPSMRAAAEHRVAAVRAGGLPIEVLDGVGESLPLPDRSVDSVLFAYILCSVDSVPGVLREAWRVLRPGGVVCVLEHIRARPGTLTDRLQRIVSAGDAWSRLMGGCDCRRDTRAAMTAAGFDTSALDETALVHAPIVSWTLLGPARPGDGPH